jgi:hypothetical protein
MIRKLFLNILLLSSLIILLSCGDDSSGNSNDTCHYDSVLTNNCFVITGDGMKNVTINLKNSSASLFNKKDSLNYIIFNDNVCIPNNKYKQFVVEIVFPGVKRGVFNWENLIEQQKFQSYINIKIENMTYVSTSGKTNIVFYKDAGSSTNVTGTYSGELQDAFGNKITITNGRFDCNVPVN